MFLFVVVFVAGCCWGGFVWVGFMGFILLGGFSLVDLVVWLLFGE